MIREPHSERIGRFVIVKQLGPRRRWVKTVFCDFVPVVQFGVDCTEERKLAAIELVERELCTKKTAGEICGFHRNTIAKLVETKQLLGIEAALHDDRGLKHPYKYDENVRAPIVELLETYPDWSDQAIAEQASKDLPLEVSRSAVARIRTSERTEPAARTLPTKEELRELAKIADAMDQERQDARQLQLNFDRDPELQQKSQAFAQDPAPTAHRDTERTLLARLEEGLRCPFAGGLMHHGFLHEVGFAELLEPLPVLAGATYQSTDVLATLFHSLTQRIGSIEALKLVDATQLGVLIGCARAPEKETIRDHLTRLAQGAYSPLLIDRVARRLLEAGQIDPEVFFVDGHFLPYYGLHVIAKGYYTVRRLALRGNELYAVTDLGGKPLCLLTESNEIDFRPIISRAAALLRQWGIERPVLVFDRGGYGVHFFHEFSHTADFVTWAKYLSAQTLARIPDAAFRLGLAYEDKRYEVADERRTVTESVQTAQKEGRSQPTAMELRLVVLKEVDSGKRMGIYTCNTTRAASDIAYYMLQRWGDSENFFKETLARFSLNYHPGYDIAELEQQPLVDNPDIALTKKALQILRKELQELEKDLIVIEAKLTKRKDKRLETKRRKLEAERAEKTQNIEQFQQKLASLPDKVSILDLLKGKPMSRCDLEKKRLYDLMQLMAFHSRQTLVEAFRSCYFDPRDIKPVLDMITTRAGYVKLVGQTLVVILDWIENKKHREAAQRFCRLLNEKSIPMMGRLKVKLFFHLSRIPLPGHPVDSIDVHSLS